MGITMTTALTRTMAATGAQQRHSENTAMNTNIYKSSISQLIAMIHYSPSLLLIGDVIE